jgi:histidyl-tRNA synthetase
LLAGEDEIKQEKYTLKHLGSGQQQLVSFQELLDILQNNRGLAL